jgi:hypothetical protein
MMQYHCESNNRRWVVATHDFLNGIDYLEVSESQTELSVYLLNENHIEELTEENVRIEGGERITDVVATQVTVEVGRNLLVVELSQPGDFSTYTLRLVKGIHQSEPPDNFDPILSVVDFSFQIERPGDFDCKEEEICPVERLPEPVIDYLAKDYASFRRLMLDRLAVTMPDWQERIPADLGMVLLEIFAYVADHLSYYQDATATEAYLSTARKRTSVRRHARLLDYRIHEGCNARVWACFEVEGGADGLTLPEGTRLLTGVDEGQ